MLTFEQMKELIHLLASNKLGGVEVRHGDFHFRVTAPGENRSQAASGPATAGVAAGESQAAAVAEPKPAPSPEPAPTPEGHVLTSPIVGTFYAAPSPDADPYVVVGDRVEKGQVVCIVEAMKLMNEIEADVDGVILEVYPENAQPVEFGEPLFRIRTA